MCGMDDITPALERFAGSIQPVLLKTNSPHRKSGRANGVQKSLRGYNGTELTAIFDIYRARIFMPVCQIHTP